MADVAHTKSRASTPAWIVVTERELRDMWIEGRGLPLMVAYTAMLSLTSYLIATNQALNFLEVRESVSLTVRMAVAVSGLAATTATPAGRRRWGHSRH